MSKIYTGSISGWPDGLYFHKDVWLILKDGMPVKRYTKITTTPEWFFSMIYYYDKVFLRVGDV